MPPNGTVETNGKNERSVTPTQITVAMLQEKASQGSWCVADSDGDHTLLTKSSTGDEHKIACSFVSKENITKIASYRSRDTHVVQENSLPIAINFEKFTAGRGQCLVPVLNHLNDAKLKSRVEERMGFFFASKPTLAECFLSNPNTIPKLWRMALDATRASAWQEVALGPGVEEFGSNVCKLCYLLVRLGVAFFDDRRLREDAAVWAMRYVLIFCTFRGATIERLLEDEGSFARVLEELLAEEHDAVFDSMRSMVCEVVEEASLALVEAILADTEHERRRLLGAANTLQNNNIGDAGAVVKPEIVRAALAVLSTQVPAVDDSSAAAMPTEKRYELALSRVREAMLRSCSAKPLQYLPVPCGDRRVTDLFGFEVTAARLEKLPHAEKEGHGTLGIGIVRLKVEGGWEERNHTVLLKRYAHLRIDVHRTLVSGREFEVAATWVDCWQECDEAWRGGVRELVTTCGLLLCAAEGEYLLSKPLGLMSSQPCT